MIKPFETTLNLDCSIQNPTQFDLLRIMQKGLQDASTFHADVIGYGAEAMDPLNVFWAIARLRVKIIHPLSNHHVYRIVTWPNPYDAVGIDRNYQVYDDKNTCVIEGMGKWVIVDKQKFTLIKPKEFILTKNQENKLDNKMFIDGYMRFKPTNDSLTTKIQRTVNRAEIDQNHHVNNVVYLDYVANAIKTATPEAMELVEYQINYSESLFMNDEFTMDVSVEDQTIRVVASRNKDLKIVFQSIIKKK